MAAIQLITFLVAGVAVGAVSSLFGIGGGTILVPLLTLGFGYSIHHAIAASLVIIVPTALTGAYRHAVAGKIRWDVALLIAVGGLLGANFGVDLSLSLSEIMLRRLFVVLLLFMAVQMFFAKSKSKSQSTAAGNSKTDSKSIDDNSIEDTQTSPIWKRPGLIALFLLTGMIMGTVSSLFGIGGGILVVPILTLGFKMKIHQAVAVSLAVIVPTSVMGAFRHSLAGHVPWLAALLVSMGGLLGAHWGVTWSHKMSESLLKRLFAVFLVIVAMRMYF